MDKDLKLRLGNWARQHIKAGVLAGAEITEDSILELHFRGLANGQLSADKVIEQVARGWAQLPEELLGLNGWFLQIRK